ncbi:hypothetical protein SERLA73DRAFT_163509 [Serpula lacrymans var. lacrymans S7.3]|uniref:DUF6532 domain-containing protein n=1 Tax=Serpula lacrymans var. lacrymans (strain S7.3) TaxID=936435 RepID=F8QE38_SERL3|nr:hypothetical protein SERLA73DRAFT_163509 [Serpula lacrymans var. lacrymans S7.3]
MHQDLTTSSPACFGEEQTHVDESNLQTSQSLQQSLAVIRSQRRQPRQHPYAAAAPTPTLAPPARQWPCPRGGIAVQQSLWQAVIDPAIRINSAVDAFIARLAAAHEDSSMFNSGEWAHSVNSLLTSVMSTNDYLDESLASVVLVAKSQSLCSQQGSIYALILVAGISLRVQLGEMDGMTPWEIANVFRWPVESTVSGQLVMSRIIPTIYSLCQNLPLNMNCMFAPGVLSYYGLPANIDYTNFEASDQFFKAIRFKIWLKAIANTLHRRILAITMSGPNQKEKGQVEPSRYKNIMMGTQLLKVKASHLKLYISLDTTAIVQNLLLIYLLNIWYSDNMLSYSLDKIWTEQNSGNQLMKKLQASGKDANADRLSVHFPDICQKAAHMVEAEDNEEKGDLDRPDVDSEDEPLHKRARNSMEEELEDEDEDALMHTFRHLTGNFTNAASSEESSQQVTPSPSLTQELDNPCYEQMVSSLYTDIQITASPAESVRLVNNKRKRNSSSSPSLTPSRDSKAVITSFSPTSSRLAKAGHSQIFLENARNKQKKSRIIDYTYSYDKQKPFGHCIIKLLAQVQWFHKKGEGVLYLSDFKDSPLPLIALAITAVRRAQRKAPRWFLQFRKNTYNNILQQCDLQYLNAKEDNWEDKVDFAALEDSASL